MTGRLKALQSEPLVHFLLIGLVLYAAAEILRPEPQDPRTIHIDRNVQAHLAEIHQQENDRAPTRADMDLMIDAYIKNETLYREARALGMDIGDEMIRERLAQRMRLMIYSGITIKAPTDEELRPWVMERADRYAEPARISFRVIGLDGPEAEARATAETANARAAADDPLKSTETYIVSFDDRPRPQLVRLFGEDFIAAIEGLEPETWTAVPSPRGWQVARLGKVEAAQPVDFEAVKQNARAHWQEFRKQAEARAALDRMLETFPVVREPYDPALLSDGTEPVAEALTQ